jgi:hypothetical protein
MVAAAAVALVPLVVLLPPTLLFLVVSEAMLLLAAMAIIGVGVSLVVLKLVPLLLLMAAQVLPLVRLLVLSSASGTARILRGSNGREAHQGRGGQDERTMSE